MSSLKALEAITTAGVIVALFANPAEAAVLTSVPMQGSYPNMGTAMVHVSFLFLDQPTNNLSVIIDPVTPDLTPLFFSHPADTFDPAYPWAAPLDRMAFSRRYGFVVHGDSDPLPSGHSIWIRHLEASPGLQAYRYRSGSTPATSEFSGLFGTGGTSDTLEWNLSMFHPTYAASFGTGDSYTARYEAFVVDASGQRSGSYSSVEFTLNFAKNTCATHDIWADADGDRDVDHDDFGVLQACFTGPGTPIPTTSNWCQCFDRDGDKHIDSPDLGLFTPCVTGPTINWSPVLRPECAD